MNKHNDHLIHARQLRADILGSPAVWLPRRDILLDWLNAFLLRVTTPEYALDENEAPDLAAVDEYLRKRKVPAAA